MTDLFLIISKRWKLIVGLSLVALILALVISLMRPKEYLATVTALPANSLTADKARIFSTNIESLYPEIGTPDELDRIEGTAKLDTLYIAVVQSLSLTSRYGIDENSANSNLKAAWTLKKKTEIKRSAYGELKIKVWDGDPNVAAQIANALFNTLNTIHRDIQNANNEAVLGKLREETRNKQQEIDSLASSLVQFRTSNENNPIHFRSDTFSMKRNFSQVTARFSVLNEQVKEYNRLIAQYELAVKTNPHVLIAVENARPAITHDKPKILQTALFAFGASLIFSFLLALFAESRNARS